MQLLMDSVAVQCGTAADGPHLIRMGKNTVQIQMENGRKIAISNYAMLKIYGDTCASVLKEGHRKAAIILSMKK